MRAQMEGTLEPVEERTHLGTAEVRAIFGSGSRRVAGAMVTEGLLRKDCLIQVGVEPARRMFRGILASVTFKL